eukprot:2530315-Ditylum_brightwellii.AAC.1
MSFTSYNRYGTGTTPPTYQTTALHAMLHATQHSQQRQELGAGTSMASSSALTKAQQLQSTHSRLTPLHYRI